MGGFSLPLNSSSRCGAHGKTWEEVEKAAREVATPEAA
jgi:hypothetical protein